MKILLLIFLLNLPLFSLEKCDIASKNNPAWCPKRNFNWNLAITLCNSIKKDNKTFNLPTSSAIIADKNEIYIRCVEGEKK